jgi:hypothetical protein
MFQIFICDAHHQPINAPTAGAEQLSCDTHILLNTEEVTGGGGSFGSVVSGIILLVTFYDILGRKGNLILFFCPKRPTGPILRFILAYLRMFETQMSVIGSLIK